MPFVQVNNFAFSFFLLKMNMGGSYIPLALIAQTTVVATPHFPLVAFAMYFKPFG